MQVGDEIYIPAQEELEKLGWHSSDNKAYLWNRDGSVLLVKWCGNSMIIDRIKPDRIYFSDERESLWASKFFVEQWSTKEIPPSVNTICQCIWKRHPLYCKCPK